MVLWNQKRDTEAAGVPMGREGSGPFIWEELWRSMWPRPKPIKTLHFRSYSNWLNNVHATYSEPMRLTDSEECGKRGVFLSWLELELRRYSVWRYCLLLVSIREHLELSGATLELLRLWLTQRKNLKVGGNWVLMTLFEPWIRSHVKLILLLGFGEPIRTAFLDLLCWERWSFPQASSDFWYP